MLTFWLAFCSAHHAAVPTPPAGFVPPDDVAPFTPQAARTADMPSMPAPVPAEASRCLRDILLWVMPRHTDGAIADSCGSEPFRSVTGYSSGAVTRSGITV